MQFLIQFNLPIFTVVEVQSRVGLSIFLCLGSSQQHKNNEARIKMITMNPIIILQITTGKPQMIFGEPASIGGHIRAVNVTDCWYSPVDELSTLLGPEIEL